MTFSKKQLDAMGNAFSDEAAHAPNGDRSTAAVILRGLAEACWAASNALKENENEQ